MALSNFNRIGNRPFREYVEGFSVRELVDENIRIAHVIVENRDVSVEQHGQDSLKQLRIMIDRNCALDILSENAITNQVDEIFLKRIAYYMEHSATYLSFRPECKEGELVYVADMYFAGIHSNAIMQVALNPNGRYELYREEVVHILDACIRMGHRLLDYEKQPIDVVYRSPTKSSRK